VRLCLPELPVNKSKAAEQIFHQFLYLVTLLELSEILKNITLDNDHIDAQIFKYITILYMHMFRAISSASSGGQIVLIQRLVSSLSVSDRPVHRLRKNWRKKKVLSQPVHRTDTYWEWRYQTLY
jgi:hypothetical protein